MRGARAEASVVPVRQRATRGVRGEVGAEPALLERAGAHVQVRVQRDNVPVAQVVAVVACARLAGRDAEVGEVAASPPHVVVVVSRNRVGALPVASPRRLIARHVVVVRAIGVRVVPQREHAAGNTVEQPRGRRGVGVGAGRNVSGTDEDLGRRGSFHERRERVDQGCPGSRCDRHAHGIPTRGGIYVGGVRRRPVGERSPISGPVAPADRIRPCGRGVRAAGHAERQRRARAGTRAQVRACVDGWGEDTMRLHAAGGDRDCGRNEERPAHSGPAIGSDTRASQPLACTRLARVSEPPCASAICRDSASPIPEPSAFVV